MSSQKLIDVTQEVTPSRSRTLSMLRSKSHTLTEDFTDGDSALDDTEYYPSGEVSSF